MSYAERLKDPRWQQKRLRIMDRDGWQCIACHSKEKTLNVHHTRYVQGRMPWEYADEELHTLCQDCHADEHGKGKKAIEAAEAAARAERERVYRETMRLERPEEYALTVRLEEIDAEMPGADDDRKDALTLEKVEIALRLRKLGSRRFRGYRS